jgi:predicted DNA-binding transcriptional regulator YafY
MPDDPQYASFKRSLCILRRLALGPADRATLAQYVAVVYDDAYGDLTSKSEIRALENDLKRLRNLGVEYEYSGGEYRLLGYGEFAPVALSERDLNTLAFLTETFAPDSPNGEAVQALIRRVADWLPEPQADSLEGRRQRWRIDLGRRDQDVIEPEVQAKIEQAITQRRLLRFAYLSPNHTDGAPRIHTVQPWHLTFDTTLRHLYLEAYMQEARTPEGVQRAGHWLRYRLGRILPEGMTILPDKFAPVPPKRPRVALEYLLSPTIARLGDASRHFDDMQVHGPDPDGWLRVTATTTDLFSALQQLLHYGPNCKVIGGPEARRRMGEVVAAMARNYGIGGGER